MSDALDWRDLFKRYMMAVYNDDYIVAHRHADPDSFEGTEEERAAVWALFVKAHREEFPKHSALRTLEEEAELRKLKEG